MERLSRIAVGSDADLVVYDPDHKSVISARTHHGNFNYNGFEGVEIDGRPSAVTVRGKVQVKDGEFIGDRRRGKLLCR